MTTILLVEDASDLARMIARELEAAGYRVLQVSDGLTAVEWHALHTPDLVILDWMLPGIDGLEVLRSIRQKAATPVLMLSARSEEIDRVVGLEVGADDYLTKPFSMRELVARVHALLRRSEYVWAAVEADRRSIQAPLDCGPLRLIPSDYLALLEGAPLELTRTEFDLLCLLVRNPGRAFSRTYLLETIWGENYISGDRSVDNAILRLRRKLGPFGDSIETMWGVGYRFNGKAVQP